ncbi:hypothetical protein HDV00_007848 [Rhizophlyctis rosea]|nr:hypothetical protein HDV00_007848 [Rhizophlyctis rosea]
MPKIRRERTKLHASLKPQADSMVMDTPAGSMPDFPMTGLGETFTVTRTLPDVAPLTLPAELVAHQKLPTGPASVAAERPAEERAASKRERKQQRHDRWLKKLGSFYAPKAPKPTAFDVNNLRSVLPTNDITSSLDASTQQSNSSTASQKKAVSQRARRKEAVSEIVRLQKVLGHPAFKSNPLATVRQHLQNTIGAPK